MEDLVPEDLISRFTYYYPAKDTSLVFIGREMPCPLIGILPNGTLHFEGVNVPGTESRHERTVGPA